MSNNKSRTSLDTVSCTSNPETIRFTKHITIDIINCGKCAKNITEGPKRESRVAKLIEREIINSLSNEGAAKLEGAENYVVDLADDQIGRPSIVSSKSARPSATSRYSRKSSVLPPRTRQRESQIVSPTGSDQSSTGSYKSIYKKKSSLKNRDDLFDDTTSVKSMKKKESRVSKQLKVSSMISKFSGYDSTSPNLSDDEIDDKLVSAASAALADTLQKFPSISSNNLGRLASKMSTIPEDETNKGRGSIGSFDGSIESTVSKGPASRRESTVSKKDYLNSKNRKSRDYSERDNDSYESRVSRKSRADSRIPIRKKSSVKDPRVHRESQTEEELRVINEEGDKEKKKENQKCDAETLFNESKENGVQTCTQCCKPLCFDKSTSAGDRGLRRKRSCSCKVSRVSTVVESDTSLEELPTPKSKKKYSIERQQNGSVWIEEIINCPSNDCCTNPCPQNDAGRGTMCVIPVNPYPAYCNCAYQWCRPRY